MLKSSTINTELTRRGFKLMNGGTDWDSFTLPRAGQGDPYDVTVNVNYRTHEVILRSRNVGHPHIHFASHGHSTSSSRLPAPVGQRQEAPGPDHSRPGPDSR